MKCTIPEISWHNRDPVLSVDVQPKKNSEGNFYRLASSGTDSHVLIWHLTITESGAVNLDVVTDLTRHQRAVNVVRFSPSGEFLASADDENVIIIWKQRDDCETINFLENTNEGDKEIWITYKTLRGHMQDVYDLSWSPDSLNIISGSVDNSAIVWDVHKGKKTTILSDHKGFVQGVSWDPLNQYLATLSSDRYFRIFDVTTKKVVSRCSKSILPVPVTSPLHGHSVRLFHDDTLQTFFRRLTFSPDGQLIITPAGICEIDGQLKPWNTTYIYSRYSLKQPAIVLQSPNEYTVAVRCCPILFKLREYDENNLPVIPLNYRMVFAVATKSSVYLYDTQQKIPFGLISNIHYTRLTDLSWSDDGKILIVSSTDGFCSLIIFNDNELGEIYKNELNDNDIQKENDVEMTPDKNDNKKSNEIELKSIGDLLKPTPIAIRRKPKESPNIEQATVKIIEDPTIIRSDEKFESPEKTNHPATPISIRRFPMNNTRTTPTTGNILLAETIKTNDSPTSSKKFSDDLITPPPLITKRASAKKATPTSRIAVRRQPRITVTPVDKTLVVDDALDAWPIDQPIPSTSSSTISSTNKITSLTSPPIKNRMDIDESRTEDIRLVYDDEDESKKDINIPEKNNEIIIMDNEIEKLTEVKSTEIKNSPARLNVTPKTPRRVEFKTISTPKSKKKLI